MKLICDAPQLLGDYGTVVRGELFECSDEVGASLIKRGLAHNAMPPKVIHETKPKTYETKPAIFETPEVSPEQPFRHGALPDAEPAPVATASDPVLPGADLSESGAADRGRRRGRPRSRTEG